MRLLLDTHIWLWNFQDPRRLGRRVLRSLQDRENELWLSPMSAWEALTLNYKGRIRINEDLATWLARATAGTREAPVTHEIALVARQLPLHQDPADRIPAATAEVLDLTLVHGRRTIAGIGNDSDYGQPLIAVTLFLCEKRWLVLNSSHETTLRVAHGVDSGRVVFYHRTCFGPIRATFRDAANGVDPSQTIPSRLSGLGTSSENPGRC